jgi:hypothetical protein
MTDEEAARKSQLVVRETLTVGKRVVKKIAMERFNLKKVN